MNHEKMNRNPFKKELVVGNSRVRVDLKGGRLMEVVLNGVIVIGTYKCSDGKERNTHLCLPNFYKEGMPDYHLLQHGSARDIEYMISGLDNNLLTISGIIKPTEYYRSKLLVKQDFELVNGIFIHKIGVKNSGKETVPLNIGVHNYWNTPNGWQKATINSENIANGIRENNTQTPMKINQKNIIYIPGMKNIIWELDGFSNCVLWTGRVENDGKMKYDHKFMCAEPVRGSGDYFGSKESLIEPGQAVSVSQMIYFQE